MNIKTYFLPSSSQLHTKTKQSFAHQCQVSENDDIINLILEKDQSKYENQCILIYGQYLINLNSLSNAWDLFFYKFDTKQQQMIKIQSSLLNAQNNQFTESKIKMLILARGNKSKRIYWLGDSQKDEQIHFSLNIIRIINQYAALNTAFITYYQPIFRELCDYLYGDGVQSIINIIASDYSVDRVAYKKLCEMKGVSKCMDTAQSRRIQRQIYEIKREEKRIIKEFNAFKSEFTQKVSTARSLLGLSKLKYEQISIDTIRTIKQGNIQHKTKQYNELLRMSNSLEERLQYLGKQKEQYEQFIKQNQHKLKLQICSLKNELAQSQIKLYKRNFSRGKNTTDTRPTTAFSWNSVLIPLRSPSPARPKQKEQQYRGYDLEEDMLKQRTNDTTAQYKNNQKKVAKVMKQSRIDPLAPIEVKKDYRIAISKIDFQMEKQLEAKKEKYKIANAHLMKLLIAYRL